MSYKVCQKEKGDGVRGGLVAERPVMRGNLTMQFTICFIVSRETNRNKT